MADAIQDHYPDSYAHCYGCGRLNTHGLQIRSVWTGEEAVCVFTPGPHQVAIPGYVYGGLIASILDCHSIGAAAAAAEQASGRRVGERPAPRYVTASLSVDFLRPTPLGVELEARARPEEVSARKVVVWATLSAAGEVCARSRVVAVPLPESMA